MPSDRIDDALSRGFDAGNYASAYVSEDFDIAVEREAVEEDGTRADFAGDAEALAAFDAAFIVGFFSSFETHEVPEEHVDDLLDAEFRYGPRMRASGINAAPRHPFVEPNPLEWASVREQAGIRWRRVPDPPVGELPTFADFCAHGDPETGRYDCGMSREDHGVYEETDKEE